LREGGRPTVFGDGTQTRDYIYVGDVVAAAIAAASSEVSGPINIGTGRETDVLELAEALRQLGGRDDFEPQFASPRAGEVQRISLDATRAEQALNWRPDVSLDEGLRQTLASL
jgi:UDP-glucose 4-epimerase